MKNIGYGVLWGAILMVGYLVGQVAVLGVFALVLLGHTLWLTVRFVGKGVDELWMGVILGAMLGFGAVYVFRQLVQA